MDTIQVRNPRNGQFDYQFTPPEPEVLQRRTWELRVAQREWSARPVESRAAILQRWRARLLADRAAIVEAVTVDTGRHLLAQAEFGGTLAAIDRWCAQAPGLVREDEGRSQTVPSITYRSQLVPYALVGVISPWNFPLTLSLIDTIPTRSGSKLFAMPVAPLLLTSSVPRESPSCTQCPLSAQSSR